jgi:hypothetical protein
LLFVLLFACLIILKFIGLSVGSCTRTSVIPEVAIAINQFRHHHARKVSRDKVVCVRGDRDWQRLPDLGFGVEILYTTNHIHGTSTKIQGTLFSEPSGNII